MQIQNLILEVTRRCNFSCDHCLRGEAQKKDIDFAVINALLDNNNIDYISSVTFTGGEPSLNVKAIDYFLTRCEANNIEIGNFYIATNGGESSGNIEFLQMLIKLYCYCSDNEISSVEVSKSDFHNWQDDEAIQRLKCLSFVRERENLDYKSLIHEGRAKKTNEYNGTIDTARRIEIEKDLKIEYDSIINDELYINVKGDVCLSCDISYKRQDKNKIGNILNDELVNMQAVANV